MSFLLSNWKYLVILILMVSLAFAGTHIKMLNAKIDLVKGNLVVCQEANEESANVFRMAKESFTKLIKACEERVAQKLALIAQLQKIDAMQEPANEKDRCNITTDPLYNQYMRMFDKPASR